MEKINLELPPVGVKMLKESLDGFEGVDAYKGASYCDAVRLATFGFELLVLPGSIEVCKWSPVVLGLKEPENEFERSLEPRLEAPVSGVYVAPVWRFRDGVEPDVVIVRGRPAQLRRMAAVLGSDDMVEKYRGRIGWTALGVGGGGIGPRTMLTHGLNRLLAGLRRRKRFDDFTRTAFRSRWLTGAFEKLAKNTVADMSMCRNSSVLPFLENAGNVSFFCVGGITWGGNSPYNMTSGLPYGLFQEVCDLLEFPGK